MYKPVTEMPVQSLTPVGHLKMYEEMMESMEDVALTSSKSDFSRPRLPVALASGWSGFAAALDIGIVASPLSGAHASLLMS